jgi:hypothetical protein
VGPKIAIFFLVSCLPSSLLTEMTPSRILGRGILARMKTRAKIRKYVCIYAKCLVAVLLPKTENLHESILVWSSIDKGVGNGNPWQAMLE